MTVFHDRWGEEEKDYVRKMAGKKPVTEIATHLGRSESSVMAWAVRNKVSVSMFGQKAWTNKEMATCKASAGKLTAMALCALLGRSENSVRMFCLKHGIQLRPVNMYQSWAPEQTQYLRDNAGKIPPKEMAYHLHRDVRSIYQYARYIGVKLSSNVKWEKTELDRLRLMIRAGMKRSAIPDFPRHKRSTVMAKYTVISREINRKY